MINRTQIKIAVIVFLIIMAIIAGFMIFNDIKDKRVKEAIEARITKEIELKQAKKEYKEREIVLDSLKSELIKSLAVIEYQKKYPQIIIKKYETKSDSILKMNNSQSTALFEYNIIKYKKNRGRYNLSRFVN